MISASCVCHLFYLGSPFFLGVELGDIGPTYGAAATDNGFMRLHNVRIPRENMLMKFSKVITFKKLI